MTRAQAISKARKIRARMLRPGTLEEGQTAYRMYQDFLGEHGLTDHEVGVEETPHRPQIVRPARRPAPQPIYQQQPPDLGEMFRDALATGVEAMLSDLQAAMGVRPAHSRRKRA